MDGILNINKPVGMTSFDVVARVRRLSGVKKVGHAGTLDPDASGVLPVCVGKATKVIEFLMEKDKSYRVGLYLGRATDTQDASGKVLYEKPVEADFCEIEKAVKSFIGNIEQIPPMFSAIRVAGKRLYDLARKGIEIERKARSVTFYNIEILSMERISENNVNVIMDVECSKGTYMRTLCHDIGELLGCGGHMSSLIRTRSGPFSLENSFTIDDLTDLHRETRIEEAFLTMDQAILYLPSVVVSSEEAKRLKNGLGVVRQDLTPGYIRVYHEKGSFLAIGVINTDMNTVLRTYKWIGSSDEL